MSSQPGDMSPALSAPDASACFTACFSVVAETDPNTLSRVLEPFTKRGLTPCHVYAMQTGANGESMQIDMHLAGTDTDTAWRLANDLRGLWVVEKVLTSEKRFAGAG